MISLSSNLAFVEELIAGGAFNSPGGIRNHDQSIMSRLL